MKRNILFGTMLFIFVSFQQLYIVESLLLLSIFIFVPLILYMVSDDIRNNRFSALVNYLYPLATLGVAASIFLNRDILIVVWFLYTLLISLYGLRRILVQGIKPLGEFSINIGFLYLSLGGFWYFAYATELDIMGFSKLIILLTAIHFHYSAFLLPIFIGFLGRKMERYSGSFTFAVWMIMVSPLTIALGITFSRMVEFIAVVVYVIAITLYSVHIFRTKFVALWSKILLSISSAVLVLTVSLSLAYAFGRVSMKSILSINEMIFFHGLSNLFGVILPALIGWLLELRVLPRQHLYVNPMSRIIGKRKIGDQFLSEEGLIRLGNITGLVDCVDQFRSPYFDPSKLAPLIREFYEKTSAFELNAFVTWSDWFQPFAKPYNKLTRKIQQLHLVQTNSYESMSGVIIPIHSKLDGRENVRAWLRKNPKGETVFLALYSSHENNEETYMNIALPLPFSNMTGILKWRNQGNKLLISSRLREDGHGDEGIYLVTPLITIKLPLSEQFLISHEENNSLTANHQMWLFGIKFLEINYSITKVIDRD